MAEERYTLYVRSVNALKGVFSFAVISGISGMVALAVHQKMSFDADYDGGRLLMVNLATMCISAALSLGCYFYYKRVDRLYVLSEKPTPAEAGAM